MKKLFIEIGDEVKDELTGKSGTVSSRTEFLYGCPRLAIHHGFDRDGKPLESLWIDEPQGILLTKQVVSRKSSIGSNGISLGDRIKCRITGLEGICYGVSDFMYGCTRVGLAPSSLDRDGKPKEIFWADAPQFEIVKTSELKSERKNTGGPMSSVPTQNKMPERRY